MVVRTSSLVLCVISFFCDSELSHQKGISHSDHLRWSDNHKEKKAPQVEQKKGQSPEKAHPAPYSICHEFENYRLYIKTIIGFMNRYYLCIIHKNYTVPTDYG